MRELSNRRVRDFGWGIAHGAVSRRPPIPLHTIVARNKDYTHAAKVWDLYIVQRAILCRAVPNPKSYDSQRFRRCRISPFPRMVPSWSWWGRRELAVPSWCWMGPQRSLSIIQKTTHRRRKRPAVRVRRL